jgi:branched-subunit amino acid transport protein
MISMVVAVIAIAAVNFAFKAAGPAVLGDRRMPPRVQAVLDTLPIALLSALIVVEVLGQHWQEFDWTVLPGLGAAIALRAARQNYLVCIVAAVVCTAALRIFV